AAAARRGGPPGGVPPAVNDGGGRLAASKIPEFGAVREWGDEPVHRREHVMLLQCGDRSSPPCSQVFGAPFRITGIVDSMDTRSRMVRFEEVAEISTKALATEREPPRRYHQYPQPSVTAQASHRLCEAATRMPHIGSSSL